MDGALEGGTGAVGVGGDFARGRAMGEILTRSGAGGGGVAGVAASSAGVGVASGGLVTMEGLLFFGSKMVFGEAAEEKLPRMYGLELRILEGTAASRPE